MLAAPFVEAPPFIQSLAVITSSRSDDVTKSVCPCFRLSECFVKSVSRVFQECLKGVSRVFQGSFKSVSMVFHECFKGVSRVFQGCFKSVSKVFQECFKGVSRV